MLHEQRISRGSASPVSTSAKLRLSGDSPRKTKQSSGGTRLRSVIELELEQRRLLNSRGSSLDEVVRLAQRGDPQAFEQIYRLHSPRVYALCVRWAGDPMEAEDFVQDVFLQLFRKIHTFRGESAFSSWLYRLAANQVFMRFRKKKLTMNSLESPTESDDESNSTELQIGVTDLRLSGLFDRINLQAAIRQLPQGYKAMFILHDVQGYEHNEIAKILGCSVGNSKSQLHKARKRLREVLRGLDLSPKKCGLVRRKDQNRTDGVTNERKDPETVVSQKERPPRSLDCLVEG
jgi:RNA polymerase sigma-70 factor (ECF subfamily)